MTSVDSAEAFGSPSVSLDTGGEITPGGIASGEQFGQPQVESSVTVTLTGVSSAEVVGSPALLSLVAVLLNSVTSGEQFGSPTVSTDQSVSLVSVDSAEAIGSLVVAFGGVTPDEVVQVLIDAVSADANSCTVVLIRRSTTVKRATIVEQVLDVSPAQQV